MERSSVRLPWDAGGADMPRIMWLLMGVNESLHALQPINRLGQYYLQSSSIRAFSHAPPERKRGLVITRYPRVKLYSFLGIPVWFRLYSHSGEKITIYDIFSKVAKMVSANKPWHVFAGYIGSDYFADSGYLLRIEYFAKSIGPSFISLYTPLLLMVAGEPARRI